MDNPVLVETNPTLVGKGSSGKFQATYDGHAYDAAGNQVSHSDAGNRIDSTTLDAANRTVQDVVSAPGATGTTLITTTNSFDPDGNTVSWTRKTQSPGASVQTQTDSASFDAADRQVKAIDNGLTTGYGYDAAGQQRTQTIVDGATTVTTTMDSEGRAVALSEGLGGAGPYVGRLGYNLNDLPITMTLPGGITEGQGYDASSRLVTTTLSGPASLPATTTLNSAYAYGYNAVNWTTRTTTLSGTDTLVHDAQGRLTGETGPQVVAKGGTYAWTYDTNGALTSQIGDDGFPVTYTYTQAITPNEVQTMVMGDGQPTAYYGYDVHGDTTAITDGAKLNTHMIYDSQARPVQVTFLDHTTPATITLAYNPAGLRSEYTVVEGAKPTLDEKFTYRAGVLGQMQLVQGSLAYTDTYLYTEAGAPYELLRQQGGATNRYWYEVDGRGNVVALTDVNGKVVDRYAYDSWGELTSDDGVNESVPQQLRYAGYWYDEKVSWYWLRVRYYDPEIERFLAPDPSQQDGARTYAYVGDNPIDATDPSGLDAGSTGFSPSDVVSFFAVGVGVAIAVVASPEVLAGAVLVGTFITVGEIRYRIAQIRYGNPAAIPVPCPAPAYGSIQSSGVGGGGTTVSSGACTAATVAPIYIRSAPNSYAVKSIAGEIPDLNGTKRDQADALLRSLGATIRTSAGGYKRYIFPDRSEIQIRPSPDNEVIRLEAPEYEPGPSGARTNRGQRLSPNGERLPRNDPSSHNTGERVVD